MDIDPEVTLIAGILRGLAPVVSPDALANMFQRLAGDKAKVDAAADLLKGYLKVNGRDGENRDQYIKLRTRTKK